MKSKEGNDEMWIKSITWNVRTYAVMVGGTKRERKNI
jgi:hypothetical protein